MKRIAKMRRQTRRARGETIVWPKSDCAIIPKKRKGETRFDSFQQFAFETVFGLIALPLGESRIAAENSAGVLCVGLRLGRDLVHDGVYSSPCAFHCTMGNVLSGNRRIFRHVSRRANRSCLNAANANPQR